MTTYKINIPSPLEPVLDSDGIMNPSWYNFFNLLFKILGSGTGNINISGSIIHTGSYVGLFSTTPVVQQSKINDPAGGVTVDAEARTTINSIIDVLEAYGITKNV